MPLLTLLGSALAIAPAQVPSAASERPDWRGYVVRCLDTLLEHGTDTYGPEKTPLLMAFIDVRTLEAPEEAPPLDHHARLEDGRLHRRSTGGSNLWYDQKLIAALQRVTAITGEERYAAAADAYVAYALQHCHKREDDENPWRNGLLAWGTHVFWNAYTDQPGGDADGDAPHEILVYHPEWETLYRADRAAVRAEIDGIWSWHLVDPETGQHNRHDDRGERTGTCDFAFSGGSFALAFASLGLATDEPRYLDQALRVAGWHDRHRDPKTGLVPDAPSTGSRYDAHHCFTSVTGPFASQLLRCFELTGERAFFEQAAGIILAYDRYAWDAKAKTYHAMLALDGTPVGEKDKGSGYDAWAPYGHVDVWRTTLYSYEFPLIAAQSAAYAYELTSGIDPEWSGRADLLRVAKRWAGVIEASLPPHTGRRWKAELEAELPGVRETGGTYAENYARAISFFVHMRRITGQDHYLELAETLAGEAVEKLFENGLFKGHPAKPYYSNVDGVGLLLWALLELDAPDEPMRAAF